MGQWRGPLERRANHALIAFLGPPFSLAIWRLAGRRVGSGTRGRGGRKSDSATTTTPLLLLLLSADLGIFVRSRVITRSYLVPLSSPPSLLARSPSPRSLGPSGELLARHSWTCQALASFQTIAMVVTCSTLCQRGSGQTLRAADIGVTHLPLRCKMQERANEPLVHTAAAGLLLSYHTLL